MEPVKAPLKETVRELYVLQVVVKGVREVKEGDAVVATYVHFDGSRESIEFPGAPFKIGDQVKISFEKVST